MGPPPYRVLGNGRKAGQLLNRDARCRNGVVAMIGRDFSVNFRPPLCSARSIRRAGKKGRLSMSVAAAKQVKLKAIEATQETFKEFGQVIGPSADGEEFGPQDAQLDLSRGVPRFYIMHLEDCPLKFSTITHHASVTQCLGSIGGHPWYLGVAKPSIVGPTDEVQKVARLDGKNIKDSRWGHSYVPPAVDDVHVFRIEGSKFLKLNRGTWHAGPLFRADAMDFYNLELSNTNVVDHTTHDFRKENGVIFSIEV